MDTSDNHLQVEFDLQYQNLKADLSKLEKLVRGICETFKVGEAAIDVSIVDDAGIIEVHRKFLQKDKKYYLVVNGKTYHESFDMVLPALTADRPEPLCGLYRKNCVSIFEKCIEQKVYAVHLAMALSKSNVVLIDEKMSFWNPRIFLNVNSEEDLEDLPKEYRN